MSLIQGMKRDHSIAKNVGRSLMIYIRLLIVLVPKVAIMSLIQGMNQEHFIAENAGNHLTICIRLLTFPVVKVVITNRSNRIYQYA